MAKPIRPRSVIESDADCVFLFSNPREILSELIVGLSPIRITEVCTEGRRIRRKDPPARKQDVSNKR